LVLKLSAHMGVRSALWAAGFCAVVGAITLTTPLNAQSYAGQEKPGAAELRNAMRRLANNPKDLDALIDAGTASLQLGDTNAAIDFFTRAEAIAPNNGDVKVGLATSMLRKENPVEALRLFDEAERLGMPTRSFALDRGLAYDLVGDFVSAERQYQTAALSGPSDEITLRRGISLGVQGRDDDSMRLMKPLLEKNDPGAWRAQAFIYAANGNMRDADDVATSFLGEQRALAMRPYFQRMPLLTPAQKMAAIHFGHFPTQNIGTDSPQIAAMSRAAPSSDRLTPQGQPFGPSAPSVSAASANTPVAAKGPKFIDFNGRPQANVRYIPPLRGAVGDPVEVAVAAPAAVMPIPVPPVVVAPEPEVSVASVAAIQQPLVQLAAPPAETNVAPKPETPSFVGPAFETNPGRAVAGPIAPEPVAQLSTPSVGLPSGYQPSVAPNGGERQTAPQTPAQGPLLPAAGYSDTAGTFVDRQGVARRIGDDGSVQPVVQTVSNPATTTPVLATPSPEILLPAVVQPAFVQAAPAQTAPQEAPPRRADLNVVVGSVAVPEEEKTVTVVPVTPDVIANAAPTPVPNPAPVPAPRVVTPKPAAAKPATPKTEAAKPDEKPVAKQPKRNWVQIASGGDVAALRYDYRSAARKNPDLFKGLSGWSAAYGKTRRMVVGPFDTFAEAQAWQKKYSANGQDSLVWQSAEGTVVEPLPTR
jgi:Flp pilus assembly protein TadD